jgi:site-specific recombinase XerC
MRERGTQQKQAPGLTERDADKIIAKLDSERPKDIRDLALMQVGRDLLARSSELIAITCESIAWDDTGLAQVMMRRVKTSLEALPFQLGPDASAALRRWLDVAGITTGPVFVGLTKAGRSTGIVLSRRDVTRVLKSLGQRAKLSAEFSSHSLRVGMAQDMLAANVETGAILQAGGWAKVEMLVKYTRKLDASRGAVARYYARKRA